jgi:hypothetical protein
LGKGAEVDDLGNSELPWSLRLRTGGIATTCTLAALSACAKTDLEHTTAGVIEGLSVYGPGVSSAKLRASACCGILQLFVRAFCLHSQFGVVEPNERRPPRQSIVKIGVVKDVVVELAASSSHATRYRLLLLSDSGDSVVVDASLNEFRPFPGAQLELWRSVSYDSERSE